MRTCVGGHIVVDATPAGNDEPLSFILDTAAPTSYGQLVADDRHLPREGEETPEPSRPIPSVGQLESGLLKASPDGVSPAATGGPGLHTTSYSRETVPVFG